MNTKLILAIILVALIGVVAGTYQVTNNANTTNTFTPVETEDADTSEIDSASDAVGSSDAGSDSVNSNPPASSSKVPTSSNDARSRGLAPNGNSNRAANTNNGGSHQANGNGQSNNYNPSGTYSQSQLLQKAISQSKSLDGDGAHLVYDGTISGVKYYTYALTKDGNVIGEAEYDQYGKLTGGAFKGEVDSSNSTSN